MSEVPKPSPKSRQEAVRGLEEMRSKGLIPKPMPNLRMVIDFRDVNRGTIQSTSPSSNPASRLSTLSCQCEQEASTSSMRCPKLNPMKPKFNVKDKDMPHFQRKQQ